MMNEKDRHLITIVGKQRRGKSHFTKKFIIPLLPEPVLIADTMNEYNDGTVYQSFDDFFKKLKRKRTSLKGVHIIKLKDSVQAKKLFAFSAIVEQKHSIVIDEADKFCNPYSIDPGLEKLLNYGGHHSVSCVFAARRTAKLHRDVTSQSDFIVSFAQTESTDLKGLAGYTDFTEIIRKLERCKFLAFGDIRDPFAENNLKPDQVSTIDENNKVKWIT